MSLIPVVRSDVDINEPLTNFTQCHAGMMSRLKELDALPELLEPAERARKIATDLLDLFEKVVYEHHDEEERELFDAVLRSAASGGEQDRARAMAVELTGQHREIERIWKSLEPNLRLLARGKSAPLDASQAHGLVRRYSEHATYEEQQFLPLAQRILGRDSAHMAALGLSLHARHMPLIVGYI